MISPPALRLTPGVKQPQIPDYGKSLLTVANWAKSNSTQESLSTVSAKYLSCADWLEENYYIPTEGRRPKTISLLPHQKVILHLFFDPQVARTLFGPEALCAQTLVYSTVKKSGKTAVAGGVARWVTETWGSHVETYALANDEEQARGRIYAAALTSIELDPRYQRSAKGIPGLWRIIERDATYIPTHSTLKAVSSDYKGEAGSNPVATFWSELWGYSKESDRRLWSELTPVPTRPRSIRYVETYAGYEGESGILNDLEDRVKDEQSGSRRLEHDELDLLLAGSGLSWPSRDTNPLPLFIHTPSRTVAYWDEDSQARRMPWQTTAYYQAQAAELTDSQFQRLHLNKRVSNADQFIAPEWWDRLYDPSIPSPTPNEPLVIGADASVSGDCSALVAVGRDPRNPLQTVQRLCRTWQPSKGKPLNYSLTIEPTIRQWCTGHIHPLHELCNAHSLIDLLGPCVPIKPYNIVEIAYDEYQLHDMMTRLRHDAVSWCRKFSQSADRSVADKTLFDVIRDQRIHHTGSPDLATHIKNCAAKVPKDDNTRLRLVKKGEKSKIDAAVALSMANFECLRLNMV